MDLFVEPTEYAAANARRYVESAASLGLSEPELTPDGEGTLDVEWIEGGSAVVVWCRAAPDESDTLSYRDAGGKWQSAGAGWDLLAYLRRMKERLAA